MQYNHEKFYALYREGVRFKDWGLLKSSLQKREEATQSMRNDAGYYAIGKAIEASLLAHHIGDGLRAYEATKKSLENIEAFAEADEEWVTNMGFSFLPDCLAFVRNWAESYEKLIEYSLLAIHWLNIPAITERLRQELPVIEEMLQEAYDHQKKGTKWWECQWRIALCYYDRSSQERDTGKYATAMSVLHCILDRACKEEAGYEMDKDMIFQVLDDYIALAIRAYELVFQKARIARDNVPLAQFNDVDEQAIIFLNPLKYWLKLMPDCPEKFNPVLQASFEKIVQMPALVHPPIMQQLHAFFPDARLKVRVCKHCGHVNVNLYPICAKCTVPFNIFSTRTPSAPQSITNFGNTSFGRNLRMPQSITNFGDTPPAFRIDKDPSAPATREPSSERLTGRIVALIIINGLVLSAIWWWAIRYDEMTWYVILIAVICSLFTITNMLSRIASLISRKK